MLDSDDSEEDDVVPVKKPTNYQGAASAPKASTSKLSPKTINRLNAFVNPKLMQESTEATTAEVQMIERQTWPKNDPKSKDKEDSAYSMGHKKSQLLRRKSHNHIDI